MESGSALPTDCAAARRRLSLRLDGELPPSDGSRLERHLDRCADCVAWAAGLEGATSLLRGAALERPSRDLRLPRAGLVVRRVGAAAMAAAGVAAAAAVAVAVLSLRVEPTPLLAPRLSLAAVRSQLMLKEQQLSTVDRAKARPGQNLRPSVPPGAFAGF